MTKKLTALFLALVMCLSLVPVTALAKVKAPEYVSRSWDADKKAVASDTVTASPKACDEVSSASNVWGTPTDHYLVVKGDVTIDGNVTLDGDTNLILYDGATLTVNGTISGDHALNVYAQANGTGKLAVNYTIPDAIKGINRAAAIEVKSLTVHGGSVTAAIARNLDFDFNLGLSGIDVNELTVFDGKVEASASGPQLTEAIEAATLTVYGGSVSADAASTGSASSSVGISMDVIYLYGGSIEANGQSALNNAFGIHNIVEGNVSEEVNVYGGELKAVGTSQSSNSGNTAVGIAMGGNVRIDAGKVEATGVNAKGKSFGIDGPNFLRINSPDAQLVVGADKQSMFLNGELWIEDTRPLKIEDYPSGYVIKTADDPAGTGAADWDGSTVLSSGADKKYLHIYYDAAQAHVHEVAGVATNFHRWTKSGSLPTVAGSYFLDTDVTLNSTWTTKVAINLCLNGHVVRLADGKTGSVFSASYGSTLRICDCNGTESTHKFTVGDDGLWTLKEDAAGKFETVTGGVITGGNAENGGGINVLTTLYLEGGTIVGCKASGNGGGVNTAGKFIMTGGSIVGCVANQGGGVCDERYGNDNPMTTITGGRIEKNRSSKGGGVYSIQNVTLGGTAVISQNSSDAEGTPNNLYISDSRSVYFDAPQKGMSVGVLRNNFGAFSVATDTDYSDCFTSDMENGEIEYNAADQKLYISKSYQITNAAPESASATNLGYVKVADKGFENSPVTLTIVPRSGFELKEGTLKVAQTGGAYVIVPEQVPGNPLQYTFTMPAYSVTVEAEFRSTTPDVHTIVLPYGMEGWSYKVYDCTATAEIPCAEVVDAYAYYTVPYDHNITITAELTDKENYTVVSVGDYAEAGADVEDGPIDPARLPQVKRQYTTAYTKRTWDDTVQKVVSTATSMGCLPIMATDKTLEEGWYVVNEDVTINGDVVLKGEVNIILCDGKTLTVNGAFGDAANDSFLAIYGQEKDSGVLKIKNAGDDKNNRYAITTAGLNVYGGTVQAEGEAQGSSYAAGLWSKGYLSVYGGSLDAAGSNPGGKGFGIYMSGSDKLTVYGGTVKAEFTTTATEGTNAKGIQTYNEIEVRGGELEVKVVDPSSAGTAVDNSGNNICVYAGKLTAGSAGTVFNGYVVVEETEMRSGASFPDWFVIKTADNTAGTGADLWDGAAALNDTQYHYVSVEALTDPMIIINGLDEWWLEDIIYGERYSGKRFDAAWRNFEEVPALQVQWKEDGGAAATWTNTAPAGITVNTAEGTVSVTETANAGTYTFRITNGPAMDAPGFVASNEYSFTVEKLESEYPEYGEGYVLNYLEDALEAEEGYELGVYDYDANDFVPLASKTTIDWDKDYYVRKAESTNYKASEWNGVAGLERAWGVDDVECVPETLAGKKDACVRGVSSDMEYHFGEDGPWITGSGTDIPNPDKADFHVRYKATESAFAGMEYWETGDVFDAYCSLNVFWYDDDDNYYNDEAYDKGVPAGEVDYGTKLINWTPSAPEGYTFGGWYAFGKTVWNFDADTVTDDGPFGEEITDYGMELWLCAKWIKNDVSKAAISGHVTESSANVPNALVQLKKGTTVVAAATTDADGRYTFVNVAEQGIYNVVVTKADGKTKTELVDVNSMGTTFTANVELPVADVSSVVEYSGEPVYDARCDVSQAVVGGLDAIAAAQTPGAGEKITVKLTVEPKEYDPTVPEQLAIKEKATGSKLEILDLTLFKQVNDGAAVDIGDDNEQLLTIVIPFDFSMADADSLTILRYHGSSAASMTKNPAVGSEGFTVDKAAGTVTIYAKKFSTYAVSYNGPVAMAEGPGGINYYFTLADALSDMNEVYLLEDIPAGEITVSGEMMFGVAFYDPFTEVPHSCAATIKAGEGYQIDIQPGEGYAIYTVTKKSDPAPTPPQGGGHSGGSVYSGGQSFTTGFDGINAVYVDGKPVARTDYIVIGRTVTLRDSYLATLSDGSHTFRAESSTMKGTANFTVKNTQVKTVTGTVNVVPSKTGDMGVMLYGVLAMMSAAGSAAIVRKKKYDDAK